MFDIESIYEAKSVADAVRALDESPDAELISGGTDVLIRLRAGKGAGRPLVSIHGLSEIKGVELMENGDIRIGAGTVFSHITNSPVIQKYIPMLGEAVDTVGGPQIRSMGTIGGNICNGATSADSAPTMAALEAVIVLEGPEGERTVPISEFYTGPGKTVRQHAEVCKYFVIRREAFEGWHGRYIKYGKRKAMEIATLGCAVHVKLSADKEVIDDVRLAYGVAAPTPVRCYKAEAVLRGRRADDQDAVEEFVRTALTEVNPRSSWRASKEFRLQLIEELARRALADAVRLAGGRPGCPEEWHPEEDRPKESYLEEGCPEGRQSEEEHLKGCQSEGEHRGGGGRDA
jgi:xanthine dehydrogenase FAD-binding subunit